MGERESTIELGVAATSEEAARKKLADRVRRTDQLKPYRWGKGQSGNKSGRAKELPISDKLRDVLAMPLPVKLRETLERAIGQTLPKSLTFKQCAAFGTVCALFCPELSTFKTDLVRELRVATEGREHFRIAAPGEVFEAVLDGPTELRKRVLAGIVEMMMERKALYGLEMPKLEEMECRVRDDIRRAG